MENKDEIRLKAVRRVDPHVLEIIDSAPRTALYTYDQATDKWSKTDVEGTLMIYVREAPPLYMLIIINRFKKNNFMEALTPSCDIQDNPPFLLFRNPNGLIFGIWFADSNHVQNITAVIKDKISPSVSNPSISSASSNAPSVKSGASTGSDIMSMLTKAHSAYENKKVEPTPTSSTTNLVKPSPLRAESSNNSDVANFFAKVGASTLPSSGAPLSHTPNSSLNNTSDPTNPVLQKLFDGVAAIGGQASVKPPTSSAPIPISGSSVSGQLPPHNTPQSSSVLSCPMSLQELEGKLKEDLHIGIFSKDESSSQKPFLLSPQVFASSSIDRSSPGDHGKTVGGTNLFSSSFSSSCLENQLNGSKDNLSNYADEESVIAPLTQEQLAQAFNYLLKKPEFIQQLHEAYVQSLNQSFKTPL